MLGALGGHMVSAGVRVIKSVIHDDAKKAAFVNTMTRKHVGRMFDAMSGAVALILDGALSTDLDMGYGIISRDDPRSEGGRFDLCKACCAAQTYCLACFKLTAEAMVLLTPAGTERKDDRAYCLVSIQKHGGQKTGKGFWWSLADNKEDVRAQAEQAVVELFTAAASPSPAAAK